MARPARILWRRLDRPGHDTCALWREGEVWQLEGIAVWSDVKGPSNMAYSVTCGADWFPHSARVQGRVAAQDISLSIRRGNGGEWRVNGEELPETYGLSDLDLGFTPATNTLPLRRLAGKGQGDSAAIWLDDSDWQMKPMHQTYQRIESGRWDYHSHESDYRTALAVNMDGFVTDYPGLWVAEVD